jgi:hypothetical protein
MPGTAFKLEDVLEVSEWHVQRTDELIGFVLLGRDLSEHAFKFDRVSCVRFAQALLRESGVDTSQPA